MAGVHQPFEEGIAQSDDIGRKREGCHVRLHSAASGQMA
jgi:hypothetical protein